MCMRTSHKNKNTREHCLHVTDHSGGRFLTTHVMKYPHCNNCIYAFGFRINANLVKGKLNGMYDAELNHETRINRHIGETGAP